MRVTLELRAERWRLGLSTIVDIPFPWREVHSSRGIIKVGTAHGSSSMAGDAPTQSSHQEEERRKYAQDGIDCNGVSSYKVRRPHRKGASGTAGRRRGSVGRSCSTLSYEGLYGHHTLP